MSLYSDTLYADSEPISLCCYYLMRSSKYQFYSLVLSDQLKPTIYHTPGEQANHYTTDAVYFWQIIFMQDYLLKIKTQIKFYLEHDD